MSPRRLSAVERKIQRLRQLMLFRNETSRLDALLLLKEIETAVAELAYAHQDLAELARASALQNLTPDR